MTSTDCPTPTGPRPDPTASPLPHGEEKTLKTERLQIERKTFLFALRENPRGKFLRITEDVNGRRDSIIVPAPGLEEFRRVLEGMSTAAVQTSATPA
ncbi:MAG: RNA-binding protein [Verrucomicrobia bacterium]|nr:RNA-binding protein [Verrucomicrobiota bacterium]